MLFIVLLDVKAKVDEIIDTLNQYLTGKDMVMMQFMSNKKLTRGWLISHQLDEGYLHVLPVLLIWDLQQ